jgi:hypothetical protein
MRVLISHRFGLVAKDGYKFFHLVLLKQVDVVGKLQNELPYQKIIKSSIL